MTIKAVFIAIIFSINSYALELSLKLRSGDILLQPLHCWACNLIEAETESEFSHIGVVTKVVDGVVFVGEAFTKVREVTLDEFNSKTQKGLKLKVMRPYFISDDLSKIFDSKFKDLPYDSGYLWNDDEIYCSELLYKLFESLNMVTPKALPMTFTHNREYWFKYFKGNIPDGIIGISPRDFDDEKLFKFIGHI